MCNLNVFANELHLQISCIYILKLVTYRNIALVLSEPPFEDVIIDKGIDIQPVIDFGVRHLDALDGDVWLEALGEVEEARGGHSRAHKTHGRPAPGCRCASQAQTPRRSEHTTRDTP